MSRYFRSIALFFSVILFVGNLRCQQENSLHIQQQETIDRLLRDEDALSTYKELLLICYYENSFQLETDSIHRLTWDYYIVSYNAGDALCRFYPYRVLLKSANSCLQNILKTTRPLVFHGVAKDSFFLKRSNILEEQSVKKTILDSYCCFIQDAHNMEMFDNEVFLMYKETGLIDVCYFADGWEGWEEPIDFVERFKKVKTKLMQDPQTWKDFNKFLRASRATRHRDPVESRAILYQYYRQLQDSRLNVFFDFDALYEISRQYNQWQRRKNKQAELTCVQTMRTNRDWYEKVVSNYRYYKHNDTDQRKELRDSFEKYLSQ